MNTNSKTAVKGAKIDNAKALSKKGKAAISANQKKKQQRTNKKKANKQEVKINNGKLVGKEFIPDFKPIAAPGVISTIDITEAMCPQARQTWSCALISRLAALDSEHLSYIYYVYQAMDADFVAVAQNKVPILSSRPAFVNTLHELVKAKTINSPRLKISYQFDGTLLSGTPNPTITIDGSSYYMYNPGDDTGLVLSIMELPTAVTLDAAITRYNSALADLVGNSPKKMLRQQQTSEGSKIFENDATGYSQRAAYTGTTGSCAAGGYASAELETYGSAMSTLSTFVTLKATPTRVAHELQFASIDTCWAYGFPYNNEFTMLDYSTKLPPIVKYIDFSQVWQVYSQWFAEMLRKSRGITEENTSYVDGYLAQPVPKLYAVLALRQALMKYFHVPQSCTQFQSYKYGEGGNQVFKALKLGTNAVSREAYPLILPSFLVENLRALYPKRYCKPGFKSERYCRWYVPCFGLFDDASFPVPALTVEGVQMPVFATNTSVPAENNMNFVDGSSNLNVYDLNSGCVKASAQTLNRQVAFFSQVCGPTANLEGTNDFNLLAFTRYDSISGATITESTFERIPPWYQSPELNELKRDFYEKKSLFEKGKTKSSKFVYKKGGSLYSLVPRAFSSSVVLTKELLSVLETMVVPSVVCYDPLSTVTVTQEGFQTAFSETQNLSVERPGSSDVDINYTVGEVLATLGKSLAPGTATLPTGEVSRILQVLQESGKGGFLDAALSGIMTFVEKL